MYNRKIVVILHLLASPGVHRTGLKATNSIWTRRKRNQLCNASRTEKLYINVSKELSFDTHIVTVKKINLVSSNF